MPGERWGGDALLVASSRSERPGRERTSQSSVTWCDVTPSASVSRRRFRASRRSAGRSSSAISCVERVASRIIREANYIDRTSRSRQPALPMGTGTAGACPRDASVPAGAAGHGDSPLGDSPHASIFTFGLRSDACSLTTACDHAGMKAWLLLAAAFALLVAIASAGAADRVVERGIVQSIDPTTLVLRALDGSDVAVRLGPATRFRLNGRPATSRTSSRLRRGGRHGRLWSRTRRARLRRRRASRGARDARQDRPTGALPTAPSGVTPDPVRRPDDRLARRPALRVFVLRPGMPIDVHRASGGVARVIAIRS